MLSLKSVKLILFSALCLISCINSHKCLTLCLLVRLLFYALGISLGRYFFSCLYRCISLLCLGCFVCFCIIICNFGLLGKSTLVLAKRLFISALCLISCINSHKCLTLCLLVRLLFYALGISLGRYFFSCLYRCISLLCLGCFVSVNVPVCNFGFIFLLLALSKKFFSLVSTVYDSKSLVLSSASFLLLARLIVSLGGNLLLSLCRLINLLGLGRLVRLNVAVYLFGLGVAVLLFAKNSVRVFFSVNERESLVFSTTSFLLLARLIVGLGGYFLLGLFRCLV